MRSYNVVVCLVFLGNFIFSGFKAEKDVDSELLLKESGLSESELDKQLEDDFSPALLYEDQQHNDENDTHHDTSSDVTKGRCSVHSLPKSCTFTPSCCTVTCPVTQRSKKGTAQFILPMCGPPVVHAVVTIPSLELNKTYTYRPGPQAEIVRMPEFEYEFGHVFNKLSVMTTMVEDSGKLRFKVMTKTQGSVSGFTKYEFNTTMFTAITAMPSKTCSKSKPGCTAPPKVPAKVTSGPRHCLGLTIPGGLCRISADCLKITCSLKFAGQNLSASFSLNKCDKPVTLGMHVKVPGLKLDWSKKHKPEAAIPIPQFAYSIGMAEGGVFVSLGVASQKGKLALTIRMMVGVKIRILWKMVKKFPINLKLLQLKLPIAADCGKRFDNTFTATLTSALPTILPTTALPTLSSAELPADHVADNDITRENSTSHRVSTMSPEVPGRIYDDTNNGDEMIRDKDTRPRGDIDHGPRGGIDTRPQGDNDQSPRGDIDTRPRGDNDHSSQGGIDTRPQGDDDQSPRGGIDTRPQGDNDQSPRGGTDTRPRGDNDHSSQGGIGTRPQGDNDQSPRGGIDTRPRGDNDHSSQGGIGTRPRGDNDHSSQGDIDTRRHMTQHEQ
ncbi:uncharacterized protein LOC125561826 [Nematostella vectensis]|uniref:uncharacterized protein LOC125561826 n=1 Tax=Nematostella vectensis TaxID=45351 RepID=UPI0020779723|nr:uncharacterized protein LOC125561826 [Nematostella vectensis]